MRKGLITARNVKPRELSAHEVGIWERLSRTSPASASPFFSIQYVRALGAAGADVRVCVISQAGTVVAFLPYQFASPWSRVLRDAQPAGLAMTDYFGLVAAPDFHIGSAALLELAELNHLGFSHLDETQLAFGLTGESPRIGLRIQLDPAAAFPLDDLLESKPKYRKDTERRTRQVTRDLGPIDFVLDVEEDREAVLDRLVEHKRAQYRRTGAPDALGASWKIRLLHEVSRLRHGACRGMLSTLHAGDQWLAMHFGLVGNGVLQYWLPVYNPAFSKYAPGRLLIHQVIAASRAGGIHTIDRGEGDTESKRELANDEHRFLRGAWYNRTVASSVTRGLHSLKWRLAL